ncbi:Cytochrome P450 monooxygenase FUM15 [Colletotrichum trifolii]|uniref:Cytochrome P450 monooxygenase FUM15 n=1 Tax=Colletotrichum trifolii TaxID=5466 RepID=A0A4R8RQA6_COLTR|nr:Cytochrome P450 monooxygenase FUM15 [Colletotrichum trifolii]
MDHHFLLGQLVNQFRSGDPREPYASWMREQPNERFIRYLDIGNKEGIVVTKLDAFKEIFQTKADSFQKPEFNIRLIAPIAGAGVAFSNGDEHKSQRRLLSAPFALTNVKKMIPVFQQKANQLCRLLDRSSETNSEMVNMTQAYSRATLDVILCFTLGMDFGSTLKPTLFDESFAEVFDPSPFGLLLIAINGVFPLVRSLPLEENRRFKAASERIRSTIREIIRKRKVELSQTEQKEEARPDLLTHMILESEAVGDPWSEDKLLHNVLNFLAAGHETSAGCLTWATHLLTRHPDVQHKAREEVSELLARKPNPDYVDLENLSYLDNVIRETLRLYTPGILAAREPAHDVQVCGQMLPRGTPLILIPAIVNTNPTIWGDDVDEFRPDRWDRLQGLAADPHAMSAFLYGPRGCIGRVFAMLEMKMLMAHVLSSFEFEPVVEEKDIKLVNPSPALRIQGGLQVRVRRVEAL